MHRIRNFIFKLRRGLSWFCFSFRQSPWQEDYQLFETIERVLLDTANYFEKREQKGFGVSVDNTDDVADMRLAAKLIRMKINEHYWRLYVDSQKNPDYVDSGKLEDIFNIGTNGYYKSTYKFKDSLKASEKDDRALEIAMNIISQKGFGWWI